MGVFDVFRGRQDSQIVEDLHVSEQHHEPKDIQLSEDLKERNSLEARNEKAIEQHPDEVTENAYRGVKQAEAIMSSWTLRALIFTYILYAIISLHPRPWQG